MASTSASTQNAQSTFMLENNVLPLSKSDELYLYDDVEQKRIRKEEPWKNDPNYFQEVRISAIALIKMVIHARSGGQYEIMGLMQGKLLPSTINATASSPKGAFVIMDAFALPVEGTETRVNVQTEAMEFMISHTEQSEKADRFEKVCGWYHSHPGYGCWLSGVDVNTQMTNQRFQDPFVAIVIDPNRTISAGKVDIGGFRTYPEGHKEPGSNGSGGYQSIPLDKIDDFGVHANEYYPLKVSVFKSTFDGELLNLLWNKYWVNTLSQSPLISGRKYAVSQLSDLAAKLDQAKLSVGQRHIVPPPSKADRTDEVKVEGEIGDTPLGKTTIDGIKLAVEAQHLLMSQVLKDTLFNRPRCTHPSHTPSSA